MMVSFTFNTKQKHYKNENGYYPTYLSDRYGFNNEDKRYDEKVEYLFIGTLLLMGVASIQKIMLKNLLKFRDKTQSIL